MAQQASVRRPRPLTKRLLAAALTLGTVGAVGAAAPPGPGEAPRKTDHGFLERDLVSNLAGRAEVRDKNLVNPWGLALAKTGQVWVSDNGSDHATIYTGAVDGQPVSVVPLVVDFPQDGAPTGVVRNDTDDFQIGPKGSKAPAKFLFAGEHGDLFAWNPDITGTGVDTVAHEDATFKGLALVRGKDDKGKHGKGKHGKDEKCDESRILVANFSDARIDVFDKDFNPVPPTDSRFEDPNLPEGPNGAHYAPFDVKTIGSKVFVTYALQDDQKHDDVPGVGHGFIDVYSTEGKLLRRLVSGTDTKGHGDVLNSPWGLEVAPKGFGKFAGDLLVGNFGDGHINVFDKKTGKFKGTLKHRNGDPIEIEGLWGLQSGTKQSGGKDSVWFAAGINGEADGLLGTLRAED
ncbi:TIGR03118 family protein [Streptomyces antnestii]|uniref:TIGR03118 family protein n=1 Tax=Streptomyces antnestii TaxID=2494256 RepID=A0A437PGK8_9ACTN|nr:TIGR03118 family protein [Streptomyces sp. San01]RVU21412.1 TIGR03118 family protein [Streptomyces sp. San01]